MYSGGGALKLLQKLLHCRCGQDKMIAQGMCSTCYTLRRQDEAYFGGFASRCLHGTATVAASVELLEGGRDRSWFTIAYLANLSCT